MPYDPSGNYSLPASYLAVSGQTIRTEQHNPPLEDIASALSRVLLRDGRAGMTGNLDMGGFAIVNVASGTSADSIATLGQTMPVGAILDYALPTAPTGWLLCDGRALASGQYPLLRAALIDAGSPYGTDGGNPRIPDFRGRVSAGRDNMGGTPASRLTTTGSGIDGVTLGASGGAQSHTLTIDEMPAHNHGGSTNTTGSHTHGYIETSIEDGPGVQAGNSFTIDIYQDVTFASGNHSHTISSQGGGQAHRNVQPTLIVTKIIKAAY